MFVNLVHFLVSIKFFGAPQRQTTFTVDVLCPPASVVWVSADSESASPPALRSQQTTAGSHTWPQTGELKGALCCHGDEVRDLLFCSDKALQIALFLRGRRGFVSVSEVRLPPNRHTLTSHFSFFYSASLQVHHESLSNNTLKHAEICCLLNHCQVTGVTVALLWPLSSMLVAHDPQQKFILLAAHETPECQL